MYFPQSVTDIAFSYMHTYRSPAVLQQNAFETVEFVCQWWLVMVSDAERELPLPFSAVMV